MINASLFSVMMRVIAEINCHENGECSLAALEYHDDAIKAIAGPHNQFPSELIPISILFQAFGVINSKKISLEIWYFISVKLLTCCKIFRH